jgi:hypothetical protein
MEAPTGTHYGILTEHWDLGSSQQPVFPSIVNGQARWIVWFSVEVEVVGCSGLTVAVRWSWAKPDGAFRCELLGVAQAEMPPDCGKNIARSVVFVRCWVRDWKVKRQRGRPLDDREARLAEFRRLLPEAVSVARKARGSFPIRKDDVAAALGISVDTFETRLKEAGLRWQDVKRKWGRPARTIRSF